jgi:hypothetical protein
MRTSTDSYFKLTFPGNLPFAKITRRQLDAILLQNLSISMHLAKLIFNNSNLKAKAASPKKFYCERNNISFPNSESLQGNLEEQFVSYLFDNFFKTGRQTCQVRQGHLKLEA